MAAIIATEDMEHTDGLFIATEATEHTDYTAGDVTGHTTPGEVLLRTALQ